jgi:sulfonate transport system substrate-binding protein
MRLPRLLSSATAAVVLALSLSLPVPASADDAKTLRVGTINLFGVASTFEQAGHDKAGDITFQIIPFTSGVVGLIAAINAGEIDVAEMGEVGPVVAQSADVEAQIIAATEPWRIGEALVVAGDSPIRTLEDLKGKKISYARATNGQWVVNKALQKAGLDITDVESVFLPAGTNTLSVLEAGQIDVAVAIDATLSAYEAQGARRLVNAGDVDVDNALFFIASNKAIAEKKEAIGAFVNQLGKHLAWASENQEKHAGFVAELLGIEPEVTLSVERNRPKKLQEIRPELIPSNQAIADELFRQKVIEKEIKVDSSFNYEFNKYIP